MREYRGGRVVGVVDSGTIVTLLVHLDEGGLYPVHFDHRPFYHMVDDLDLSPVELTGKYIEIIPADDGERVRFPELASPC